MSARVSEGTASAQNILRCIPELDNPRSLLRHARGLFDVPGVPASTQRHNRKAWAKAVQALGPKWVLAPRESEK
jgi:hypothetical protein